jgi:Na+/melibiose symporter-like transporter
MLTTILIILLVLLLVGAIPARRRWGYGGAGTLLGLFLLILLLGLIFNWF